MWNAGEIYRTSSSGLIRITGGVDDLSIMPASTPPSRTPVAAVRRSLARNQIDYDEEDMVIINIIFTNSLLVTTGRLYLPKLPTVLFGILL